MPGKPEPGLATDSTGGPVIDPTANVLQLVEAAVERLDDLRAAEARHTEIVAKLRDEHAEQVRAIMADHQKELRAAEKGRIDAIRDVDVGNVAAAAAVSAVQATTLVGQVATTAEASRVALGAALDPIQKDVAELRRVQYQQQGERAQQTETKADVQTKTGNSAVMITIAVMVVGLLITLTLGIAGIAITLLLR